MKKLLFAMAIGAALAWMFDPDAGSHRRETLKKRLEDKGLLSLERVLHHFRNGERVQARRRGLHPLTEERPS